MKLFLPKVLFLLVPLAIGSSMLVLAQEDEMIADKDMTVVRFAELEYPKLASQALIQGIVVVRAKLDGNGSVVDSVALSGAEILIPACLENIRKWHFRPNYKKEVVIVYSFWVEGTALKPGCNRFTVEPPNFATITTCAHEIQ